MPEPQVAAVANGTRLAADSLHNAWVTVPVDIHPNGTVAVNITAAQRIRQPDTLTALNHEHLTFLPPKSLRGERVPTMRQVPALPNLSLFFRSHGCYKFGFSSS